MGAFYDELYFDDRDTKDLFLGDNPRQPFFADVVKRWVCGNRLKDDEKKIVASILIFYPEYIVNNGRTEEFIEIIRFALQQPRLINPLDPERGLYLYTLLFLSLLHRSKEESLEVIDHIEKFFITFCNNYSTTYKDRRSISGNDVFRNSLDSIYTIFSETLEKSYTDIIARIMDRAELLLLKPGFNISQLPLVPDRQLSAFEGNDLRGEALEFYHKQEYDKAAVLYRKMLVNKFEQPGTLVHLARLEMMKGNSTQAEIYIVNAWRMRREAPFYVQSRILYFVVLLKMLGSEPFEEWLGCIKEVLTRQDSKMQWDMDTLLSKVEKDLNPGHIFFLKALLKSNSGEDEEGLLNQYESWAKATLIDSESWPDFDIKL